MDEHSGQEKGRDGKEGKDMIESQKEAEEWARRKKGFKLGPSFRELVT